MTLPKDATKIRHLGNSITFKNSWRLCAVQSSTSSPCPKSNPSLRFFNRVSLSSSSPLCSSARRSAQSSIEDNQETTSQNEPETPHRVPVSKQVYRWVSLVWFRSPEGQLTVGECLLEFIVGYHAAPVFINPTK